VNKRLLIAGLIVISATLMGSGLARAQRDAATQIAGGRGGNPFSDPEPDSGARVIEVQVRSGGNVDSVQLVYMLRDGRTAAGPRHGGSGGNLSVFRLDSDEYLVGISGRSGDYIDSIQFQTNKRTSPRFGGNGGDRDFQIQVPGNAQVSGLIGRAGQYLDAIGLTFTPLRRGPDSSHGGGPQGDQTSIAGGSGGSEFFDSEIPDGARIVEVRVNAGEFVDSVQMIYSVPGGRPFPAAKHGGNVGGGASFRLRPGEYIVGLSGRFGQYVDSLRIHTNQRTSQVFGGGGGGRDFRIEVPDGAQATGFVGRSGEYVDAIGLTFARMRDRGYRDRRRDR
jgi:hypothetical protein